MTTLTNSAEGGTNGTTVTAANSGGASGNAFDVVTIGANATDIFDNTHAAHGTLSYKFATGASSVTVFNRWSTSMGSSVTQTWFRVYVYLTANPGALFKIILFSTSGGATCATLNISTTGKVQFANGGGSTILTSTNSLNLNAWSRIEGFVIGSATVGQLEFKLFVTSDDAVTPDETQTSAATQNTTGTMGLWSYGIVGAGANQGPYWADDLGLSNTGYIGPAVTTLGSPVPARVIVPGPRGLRRAVIATPRLLPPSRTVAVTGRTVIPPRGRGRGAVIIPRSLLASPVPPVPGKPVLTAPLPFRIRPRGRAVVVQFTLAPAATPVPVTGRVVIPAARPRARGMVVQFVPVRPVITPARVVIADDGDAPWHIRIRRRRT